MAECRAEIRVHGLVQGVFFRGSVRREARALGLRGYARNLDDGTVEIVAEGEAGAVESLVAWCRHGPPHARVTQLDVTRSEPLGDVRDFSID